MRGRATDLPRRQCITARGRVTAVVLLLTAALITAESPAARSEEYPSWADVQQAQASEQRKQAEIDRIRSLLSGLQSRAASARKVAAQAGAAYERAQSTLTEATYRSDQLDRQTRAAQQRAYRSQQRAGLVAASLARAGGQTLTARLMIGGGAGDLLTRLGMMSQLAKTSASLTATARRDRNAAAAAGAQGRAVRRSLTKLTVAAQAAFTTAKRTAQDAQDTLESQHENEATLQAQLTVLQENRSATQADYRRGIAARRAAQAAAAAAAARNAASPPPSSGDDPAPESLPAPNAGAAWALPVGGWISSPFGPRPDRPAAGVGAFHYGTDLAAACGTTTHAAAAGTVVYAGWLGTYGNWVLIDNGNGVQTGYAHSATLLVTDGQRVSAGQSIARVGSTGASSGCHLHFEVRVEGASVDPVPFMRGRGVTLG